MTSRNLTNGKKCLPRTDPEISGKRNRRFTMMASTASFSARLLRAPCCPSSQLREKNGRRVPSAKRRDRQTEAVCYSSLGDASFPFLPKKNGGGGDEEEEGEVEGPSLVPLDPRSASLLPSPSEGEGYDDDGLFGPLALLAVGLEPKALRALADLLEDDLEARGVVPAFAASEAMLSRDVCCAFEEAIGRGEEFCLFASSSAAAAAPRADLASRSSVERPAVVLSGMSSAEVVVVVSAWRDSGNSEAHSEVLFCAAVPANWRNRTLWQLVEDIAGDAAEVEGRDKRL